MSQARQLIRHVKTSSRMVSMVSTSSVSRWVRGSSGQSGVNLDPGIARKAESPEGTLAGQKAHISLQWRIHPMSRWARYTTILDTS
jgi:hypothetical protein